jgi:probable addiction module antidote protein
MKTSYAPFEVADYFDSDASITEYLSAAAEDPNPDVFLAAIGDVAKARGIAEIARKSGLGRESLYKTLKAGSHPRFETIQAVLHALGVKLTVIAHEPEAVSRALAHPSPSGNLVTDTNHE